MTTDLRNWIDEIDAAVYSEFEHVAEMYHEVLGVAVDEAITRWAQHWMNQHHVPVSIPAETLGIGLKEGVNTVASLTIDTTTGVVTLQFSDAVGDPVAGPADSVTGAPVVPTITSDNVAVLSAGTVAAGTAPGSFTAPLTPHTVGVANIGVAPLTNSDGSPVDETAGANIGAAFALPAPVAVTVTAGVAEGLTLSVAG